MPVTPGMSHIMPLCFIRAATTFLQALSTVPPPIGRRLTGCLLQSDTRPGTPKQPFSGNFQSLISRKSPYRNDLSGLGAGVGAIGTHVIGPLLQLRGNHVRC